MSTGGVPVVAAGMHRSGTSLLAGLLHDLGIEMGERLLPSDAGNPRGYFEDVGFLRFHQEVLAAACPGGTGTWPDWGVGPAGAVDPACAAPHADRARSLLAGRSLPGPWGFKDPRATLLLDFWAALLPDARFVLCYRNPWDVVDSVRRTGHPAERDAPGFALRAWTLYNARILAFLEARPGRAILVESGSAAADPAAFARLLSGPLGIPFSGDERDLPARVRVAGALTVAPDLLPRRKTEEDAAVLLGQLPVETRVVLDGLRARSDLSLPDPAGFVDRAVACLRTRAGEPSRPAVSVVIPCHDDGVYLPDALASVQLLSGVPVELVVVDDGSTDPLTLELLSRISASGFRVVRQRHAGLSTARNRGISASSGRYILPLDADNMVRPSYAAEGTAALDADATVGVVYGDAEYFGNRRGRFSPGPFDPVRLAQGNYVDACAVLRREVWEQAGGYFVSAGEQSFEDWDLWLGAAERFWGFVYVPEVLYDYRIRSGSLTDRLIRAGARGRVAAAVVDRHPDLFARHAGSLWAWVLENVDGTEAALLEAADRDRRQHAEIVRLTAELERERAAREAAEDELRRRFPPPPG